MSQATVPGSWLVDTAVDGSFQRQPTAFRGQIGPGGPFPVEAGRYHLVVSWACPWAHRVLIARRLLGLEDLTVDVVNSFLGDQGWTFGGDEPETTPDRVFGASTLREIYLRSAPDYRGRVTVPVLLDKRSGQIVNNESAEILRIFDGPLRALGHGRGPRLAPPELEGALQDAHAWVYPWINNGVYRAGFARSQEAYDAAVSEVFAGLDRAEAVLSRQRWLVANRFTEADLRLWTTLVRFDPVYHTHFKCDWRRLSDYPALSGFLADLGRLPAFAETTKLGAIRAHYYRSHRSLNPSGIVSRGPEPRPSAADRSSLGPEVGAA
jgi:putative glutathione S-transferase